MDVIDELIAHCEAWEPWARVMGNVCAGDAAQALRSLRADLTMAGAFHKAAVAQRNSAWKEIEHLRAELAKANALLLTYGWHRDECAFLEVCDDCDCGFESLLREALTINKAARKGEGE